MENIMKNMMYLIVMTILAVTFSTTTIASVESLRGSSDLKAGANKSPKHKVETTKGGVKRNFKVQPPVVPHPTDKYTVSLRGNGCLKCHSETTYKKEKAPKVGDSHYKTRDGKTLKSISSRRYFCSQCHVTQVGSKELVENTYSN